MRRPLTFTNIDTRQAQGCAWHTCLPHDWRWNVATDPTTLCYYAIGFRLHRSVR